MTFLHKLACLLLFLASYLPAATHANSCTVGFQSTCSATDFTATVNVFFLVNHTESNADFETYDANVIFHWGLENITTGSQPYKIGEPIGLSNTYPFENEGYYDVGYSLIFEDDAAASCSGETFGKMRVLTMERAPNNRCVWDENKESPADADDTPAAPTPVASPTVASNQETDDNDTVSDDGPSCRVNYKYSCNPVDFTSVSDLSFRVNRTDSNQDFETYNAEVIWHGDLANITMGIQSFQIGESISLSNQFIFETDGNYNVGYTLIFGDDAAAAGCSGNTYDEMSKLKMEATGRCSWDEETPIPSFSPTGSPSLTLKRNVTSIGPTFSSIPTGSPTFSPTWSPTGIPTVTFRPAGDEALVGLESNAASINKSGIILFRSGIWIGGLVWALTVMV